MVKPTLLVLAAGMGSRYGSLKQMDGVGPNNEAIIDYSVYDAIRAGFGKIVFVIRKERRSLLHRMACAQLFGLKHPVELVIAQRLFKQIAAVAVDQVDLTGTQFVRCINDMLHHWLSCKRVEHLRQIGIHAGPFASGKDHHAHRTV